jgi:hypothetical protein
MYINQSRFKLELPNRIILVTSHLKQAQERPEFQRRCHKNTALNAVLNQLSNCHLERVLCNM